MITINDLVVAYGNKIVLNNLNLNMENRKIHGIIGLNGAGKTTLLNAIYGIKKIKHGSIKWEEKSISKKQMTYLTAENFFYSNITGREYLYLFANKSFQLENWNKLFKLPIDSIIDTYSTGMRKKLAILAIIKQNKDLMILDEPFNGIDTETYRIIQLVLLKLSEAGKTLIITSHIIDSLTDVSDYIHTLEHGKIIHTAQKDNFEQLKLKLHKRIDSANIKLIKNLTTLR